TGQQRKQQQRLVRAQYRRTRLQQRPTACKFPGHACFPFSADRECALSSIRGAAATVRPAQPAGGSTCKGSTRNGSRCGGNAAHNSAMLCPLTGCRNPGAISAIGRNTKACCN